MVISDVLKGLGDNSPPFQPFVSSMYTDSYEEKRMVWNPRCIKKDALFYQFRTGAEGSEAELLPDACLNILFSCSDKEPSALMSGTFLGPKTLSLKPDTQYFGVKPYSILGLHSPKVHFGELVDDFDDFTYAFPAAKALLEELTSAKAFGERIALFNAFSERFLLDGDYTPGFVDYFTVMICSSKGNMLFNNLETVTGYSERYCREKFRSCYGMAPKKYSGIMRFQNVLKELVRDEHGDAVTLSYNNAYFDQAHLIHDFKKFTDVSPERFRRNFRALCDHS